MLIDKLRAKENIGDPEVMATGPSGSRWKLMEHITKVAGDLDIDVSKWMSGSTPLGVEEPIEPRGFIFLLPVGPPKPKK